MNPKTAVVLCNLGGPDSLDAVEPFLYNLFSDPDIFRLPLGFLTQRPFAYLISRRRAATARENYAAIGGKSPILENTQQQAAALTQALATQGDYDIIICMRYWHPLTAEVVSELKAQQYHKVILLPLYPHYSITTTGSSYNEFQRQCQRQGYRPETVLIESWYAEEDYIQAITDSIQAQVRHFSQADPATIELLFSAHGLPQKIVDAGDPYENHIRATYDAVCQRLQWPHTSLCYQSRVGPLQWLKPYTDEILRQKAAAGTQQVLIYPVAFVSDHVETLHELGIEYAELARTLGIREYHVTPALNADSQLIDCLAQLVVRYAKQQWPK